MIPNQLLQKKGDIGYDGHKKIKGSKISGLSDKNGLPLVIFISAANIHDSKLYLPTLEGLRIKLPVGRPITCPDMINADAAYDSKDIREYNRSRGIKTNIPVNKRNRKHPKRGRPIKIDKDAYKNRSVIERFFSWIESYKKVIPRYERLEPSYAGVVTVACIMMIWRVLG